MAARFEGSWSRRWKMVTASGGVTRRVPWAVVWACCRGLNTRPGLVTARDRPPQDAARGARVCRIRHFDCIFRSVFKSAIGTWR